MVTLRADIDFVSIKFFVEAGGAIVDSFEMPHSDEDGGDDAFPKWKKEEIALVVDATKKHNIEWFVTPSDVWYGNGLIPAEEGIAQMKAWSEK